MEIRVLYSVLLMFMFISCSNNEEENIPVLDVNSQKWELVKMTGSFTGTETTGADMEWQEYYIFNSNATFIKSRDIGGEVKEASGTYITETFNEQEYLELTYSKGKELIASCSGNDKEQLFFSKGDVLKGNWNICDGPELEYKQLKK